MRRKFASTFRIPGNCGRSLLLLHLLASLLAATAAYLWCLDNWASTFEILESGDRIDIFLGDDYRSKSV